MNDEILFTPSALLDFLSQVEELSDKDISITESEASILVEIGDSSYEIPTSSASDVPVEEEVIEQVADVNEEGYEGLDLDEDADAVEGGLIKELFKTLAIGGLVRLTKNAIKNA